MLANRDANKNYDAMRAKIRKIVASYTTTEKLTEDAAAQVLDGVRADLTVCMAKNTKYTGE